MPLPRVRGFAVAKLYFWFVALMLAGHAGAETFAADEAAVAGDDRDRVWQVVHKEIARVLAARKLGHVAVERTEQPPEQSPGGNYRTVVPLKKEHDSN